MIVRLGKLWLRILRRIRRASQVPQPPLPQLVRWLWGLGGALCALAGLLAWQTWTALLPFPASLSPVDAHLRRAQVLDRSGVPLSVTFQNAWNMHEALPLHDLPLFLQQAFIAAED